MGTVVDGIIGVKRWWRRLGHDPAVRYALIVWLVLRVTLSALAVLVLYLLPDVPLDPDPLRRPYLGVEPVTSGWTGRLLGPWQRWDTTWYMAIAMRGYSASDTAIFAPPLYPLLMRKLGLVLGGGATATLLAGLLVSNAAYVVTLIFFYKLVTWETDEPTARRGTVYLAIFPTAFFLLAAYSESLFLLCAVAAFYAARRGKWAWAGMCGALAPLFRLPGVVLIVPLAWEWGRQALAARRREERVSWSDGLWLLLPVLGALAFPVYARVHLGTDSLFAPFTVHTQRFHGRFAWPGQCLVDAVRVLASGRFRLIEPFDLFFASLFVFLTIVAFR
ncbi:MAG: mannosyltransferase family protein, partial [Chloroflexota bacterium]|nr:mannosyltransferase family protein [Chloroflexota bacterium]